MIIDVIKNMAINIIRNGSVDGETNSSIGIDKFQEFSALEDEYMIVNFMRPIKISTLNYTSGLDVDVTMSNDGINYRAFKSDKTVKFIKILFNTDSTLDKLEIYSDILLNISNDLWNSHKFLELGENLPKIFMDTDIQKIYKMYLDMQLDLDSGNDYKSHNYMIL